MNRPRIKKTEPSRKKYGVSNSGKTIQRKKVKNDRSARNTVNNDAIRLNRYLASTGICSRREADEFIKAGLVSVNGEIITEFGTKVRQGDNVRYNGEKLKTERLVYILLNKPKDFITTLRDPQAKRTVIDLVQKACKERVYPVGRLDRNTTGVLLLTNDGELTRKLTHPSFNKMKIYHVTLDKALTKDDFSQILEGLSLEDGFFKADALSYIDAKDKKEIGIEIHSGKNKIVRRIFEHFGYTIRKLDRVYFAGLTKKGLTRGKYRFLTEQEIGMLKMGSYR
jgi:23S rRNA pseudouridine2605 synthase